MDTNTETSVTDSNTPTEVIKKRGRPKKVVEQEILDDTAKLKEAQAKNDSNGEKLLEDELAKDAAELVEIEKEEAAISPRVDITPTSEESPIPRQPFHDHNQTVVNNAEDEATRYNKFRRMGRR